MDTVDRNSPVPLYFQLKQIVLRQIEGGTWTSGDLLPSEQEIQDQYGLSRTTVRQTLSELVFEGYLVRQRGRGTFVAARSVKIAHNPVIRLGMSYARSLRWVVVKRDWVTAPPRVAEGFDLDENAQVYHIRRLRLADDLPVGYHDAYVQGVVARQIDTLALTEGESLDYLHAVDAFEHSVAFRTLEAVAATEADAALLQTTVGAPLLQIERLVTSNDDQALEFMTARYVGERFKYEIRLSHGETDMKVIRDHAGG